jgi:hypothetical protein
MERSRHASHLASRSYRGGIPDLGGGEEGAGAGDGAGAGAALSGNSAMARESFGTRGGRGDDERGWKGSGVDRKSVWLVACAVLRCGRGRGLMRECLALGWDEIGPSRVEMI